MTPELAAVSLVVAYRVEITVSSTVHASIFARSPPVHGTSRYVPDATGEIGGDASIFARRDAVNGGEKFPRIVGQKFPTSF